MRKFVRYGLISCGVLVLGLLTVLVALRIVFPPEKLKALAIEKIQSASGREIHLASVGLGLRGIKLARLEISETPDFRAGTFLKAEHLEVRLRLKPLLQKRLEVTDVLLADWTCHVSRQTTTRSDVRHPPDTTGKDTVLDGNTRETSKSDSQTLLWSIARVRSRNGTLSYGDKSSGIAVTADHIEADALKVQTQTAFPLRLSFSYTGKTGTTPLNGKLAYDGIIGLGDLNPAKVALEVKSLQIEYSGFSLNAEGGIKNFTAPEIDLKFNSPLLPAQQIKTLVQLPPKIGALPPLSGEVSLKKNGENIRIEKLNLAVGSRSGLPEWMAGIPQPIQIQFSGDWRKNDLLLRRTLLTVGNLEASVAGTVSFTSPETPERQYSKLNLQVKTNTFPIEDAAGLVESLRSMQAKGQSNVQLQITGPADAPILNGTANLRNFSCNYNGQPFSGINGTAKFSPDSVSLQTQGKWSKADFHIDLSVQNYNRSPDVHLTGSLSELDLGKVLAMSSSTSGSSPSSGAEAAGPNMNKPSGPASFSGAGAQNSSGAQAKDIKSSGKITIAKIVHPNLESSQATAQWKLSSIQPAKLTGSLQLTIGPGKFDNLKVIGDSVSLARVVLSPFIILQRVAGLVKIPLFPAFDRVGFKIIDGDYDFKNGVMTVKKSFMDSSVADVTTTGTADFATDELNLRIQAKVPGLEPIAMIVKGSIEHPSPKLDLKSVLNQTKVQKVLQNAQPAVDQAVEQGKKLLKNLLK